MTDPHQQSNSSTLPSLDQYDFHPRIADMTGTTLVMFTSPDCGACRHLRRVLHEVLRREPGWQVFEVDAQRDPALVNEFEVFHLPTIFLFKDGNFHRQLETEARAETIVSATRSALRQPAREAP